MTPLSCIEPTTPKPAPIWTPDPLANGLKTGTPADLPRVPEDPHSVHDRSLNWFHSIRPQNDFHCWLVDQISITSMRIDHNGRIERRLRDRAVFRAGQFWDDDRRLDAIKLGEGLAKAPAKVVNQLRRTPQGCDYLIERWERLERIAGADHAWDAAQYTLAFDLLGIPAEGRDKDRLNDPVAVASGELLALRKRKEEVAGMDALDRAMAEADYVHEPCEEIRRVRRHTADMQRWMKWCLGEIDKKSPHPHTPTRCHKHFMGDTRPAGEAPLAAEVAPAPQPAPPSSEAPDLAIVGEAEPEAVAETEPQVFPKAVSDRRRESLKKAESRREAKLRKLERRRA
jgi:hypothetical protein